MEAMRITVLSCRVRGQVVEARIRAMSEGACIHMYLRFGRPANTDSLALWTRAYDEALKYLDIA